MKEPTLGRNPEVAPSVTTNDLNQVIWGIMKEYTLVTNYSVAASVTTNAQRLTIWRDMKEPTTTVMTIQLLPVWLQMLNIKSFETTWKDTHWWQTIQLLKLHEVIQICTESEKT